jgi:hypothetical protein
MNNYEKEIYNYFTEESNFRKMVKVAQHAGEIKKLLLTEFWNALITNINNRLTVSYNDWQVSPYGDTTVSWGKILIHKRAHTDRGEDNLPIIAVGLQRVLDNQYAFYGVFLNNKTNKYDVEALVNYIRDIQVLKGWQKDNDSWWPRWNTTDLDFREEEGYVKILPQNRDVSLNAVTDSLFNLLDLLKSEFDKIYEMVK